MKDLGVLLTVILIIGAALTVGFADIDRLEVHELKMHSFSQTYGNSYNYTTLSEGSWIVTNPTSKDVEVKYAQYTITVVNATKPLAIVEIPAFEVRKKSQNQNFLTQKIIWQKNNFETYIRNNPSLPVVIQGELHTSFRIIEFAIDTDFREFFAEFYSEGFYNQPTQNSTQQV